MKERGMIFNGEIVRAILEGRKTQTRRPCKPQPPAGCSYVINARESAALCYATERGCNSSNTRWVPPTAKSVDHRLSSPYGQPGDRIWVRETHSRVNNAVTYQASGHKPFPYGWSPSIHMPRWASRITLEIMDVRVQRIREISDEDILAEGFGIPDPYTQQRSVSKYLFSNEWEKIYPGSWERGDYVWVYTFKRVK